MNALWTELTEIFWAVWETADHYLRLFIGIIVAWPFVLTGVAMFGIYPAVRATIALIPVIALLLVLIFALSPLFILLASLPDRGRRSIKWLSTAIGAELVYGFFFWMIDASNDPGLAPAFLLGFFAVIFIVVGIEGLASRITATTISLILAGVAIIWLAGGRAVIAGLLDPVFRAFAADSWLIILAAITVLLIVSAVISKATKHGWLLGTVFGSILLIALLFGGYFYFVRGNGLADAKAVIYGMRSSAKEPPAPPVTRKLTNVLEPGEERPYHTLAGGPEVKLQIPEWGVWIRNGGKGCVRKNGGPEKCFDIPKYRAEHGNRVPCFNGPLELSILPESRITIQARPSGSRDCESED